ncbi:mitochondrial ornithine carrier protein [Niveomyces insectorum RCEF 264]|uniref:Mitochondrial ornithine carrier protein n=1 Tax=Niveomyces insectorum RCEF 264 TaxID=1081102 RepID=A0A167U3R6_9HYPO|nr:mitochondrial ornithine carrier protein [Niveomyces insectorum RCEF 264]
MAVTADAKTTAPVLARETASPALAVEPRAAVMEATEDILYGSIAGIVGKYIEYPFDTVKVRLQSQPDHLPLRYRGPLDCFRQSIRADGLAGLYRGISAPLVGAALETSSLFLFERLGRSTLVWTGLAPRDAPLSLPALWFTGAFSGVFTSFILTPIELVKCKIQVPGDGLLVSSASASSSVSSSSTSSVAAPTIHRRPLTVIGEVYRHEGLRGFWHGQLGTLIREAGGCAAWFGSKETTSSLFRAYNVRAAERAGASATTALAAQTHAAHLERLRTEPLPLWQQALAGASAGMSYNFLFFPADTVKSRMQTTPFGLGVADAAGAAATAATGGGGGSGRPLRRTFWDEARALWRQAGGRGFYRGCGITVARSAPSSAFIFIVFDGLKTHLPLA